MPPKDEEPISLVNCWNLLQENGEIDAGCVLLPFEAEEFSCEECNEGNRPNETIAFDDAVELLARFWREAVAAVAGRSSRVPVVGATPRYIGGYGPLLMCVEESPPGVGSKVSRRNLDVCPAKASGRLGRFAHDLFFPFKIFSFGEEGTSCPGRKTPL